MSGICAVCWREGAERTAEAVRSLTAGLCLGSERVRTETVQGAGVGVAARFETQQFWKTPEMVLACDAELYNIAELQALAPATEPASADATTAALLARLYERFGSDFVEKLRGPFAVAIWARRERQLLAATDGFGIKRLAYYQDGKVLAIGSRVDAVARFAGVELEINPRAIVNLVNYSVNLGPETIFSKMKRLAPGDILLASEGQMRTRQYWDMRYGLGTDSSEERLSRELESVVERSVAAHSEGESSSLGAYLSGGTDSSTVVGMMTKVSGRPVKAFSIGFEEHAFNELEYADVAAKRFQAEHHKYLVSAQDCFEAVPDMVRYFDEPFGNSSAIPTYFCGRLAAQTGVRTLLAGDGGDELFGGNERYLTDKFFAIYHNLPRVVRKGLIEPPLARLPFGGGVIDRARGYVRRANMPGVERLLSFQFLFTHAPNEIFHPDFLASLGEYSVGDIPSRHYSRAAARDHLDRLLYVDMKITLADSDLPKVTCMSELAGIQTRFPFLDRSVAEFSGHIPARLKVKGFEKRYLFKRAFRNLLPREIVQKKKHGFGIPVSTWLKTDRRLRELSRDALLSPRSFGRGYFRREFIESLFRQHEADDTSYYGDTLWTFLALELWHRQMVDEPAKVSA
jgi:asparagine synthase (glutamine-hydrolysing)